jgi:DNA-binding CsgD family transcriptional regulator
VEIIIGREKVVRCLTQLTENAKSTFDSFTKPPYVPAVDTDALMLAQQVSISRGLRSRSVYEGEGMSGERTLAVAEQSSRMGEQVRITPQLPMKLALFDGHSGLVPLKADEPGLGVLLVHASPLLDALIALFESVWARSVPLPSDNTGGASDELDQRARQVLLLMSGGLKDESIGRVLGMSRRTVQKHVSEVMTLLGARSRFQAALLAQERGWVAGER